MMLADAGQLEIERDINSALGTQDTKPVNVNSS